MHFTLPRFNNTLLTMEPPRRDSGDIRRYTRTRNDRVVHFIMAILQMIVAICIIVNGICMILFKFFLADVCAGFWCSVFFVTSGIFGVLFTAFPMPKLRYLSLISCLFNICVFYMIVILIGMVGAAADTDVPKRKIRIVPHVLNIFFGLCGFMTAFIQATTVGWKTKGRHQNVPHQQLEMVALGSGQARSHQEHGFRTNLHVPEGHMAERPITPRSPVLSSSFRHQLDQDVPPAIRPSAPQGDFEQETSFGVRNYGQWE